MSVAEREGVVFTPPFKEGTRARALCLRAAGDLNALPVPDTEDEGRLTRTRGRLLASAKDVGPQAQRVRFVISLLADLRGQGWSMDVSDGSVLIHRPDLTEKAAVRASHAVARDRQLQEAAARAFVRRMERGRRFNRGWVSIFDLMRDGRELGGKLREAAAVTGEERVAALRRSIDPYIQVVRTGTPCALTGYDLNDIWRYFRHTWATAYSSSVGRELKVLIRDRATPRHAVIGIAAMVSPRHLVHVDRWVGWDKRSFLARLDKEPKADWARWLDQSLSELIGDVYLEDLVADRKIRRSHVARPSREAIEELEKEAEAARAAHKLYPEQGTHKADAAGRAGADWTAKARTHLYRGNRAAALAELLKARLALTEAGFAGPKAASLAAALQSPAGRDAIGTVLKYVKARHAGINALDISVCGAVAPYSPVIGGKLVAMLLTSPEIVAAYDATYRSAPSVIASSMAARPVVRRPNLVMLTTSSLYGDPLNQYTRAGVPAEALGGLPAESVTYVRLGETVGKGSHHISNDTVDEAEVLLAQQADGHRINSIFGEGVNPRLRKIRAALDLCGFAADYILEHGSTRVLYGVGLAANFRDVLLGRAAQPRYILPGSDPPAATAGIAAYWTRRWLAGRIEKPDVIGRVESHTLVHPVTHGARVRLPCVDDDEDSLFRLLDD